MLNLSNRRVAPEMSKENERLYSLKVLKTPKAGKLLARWLSGIFLVLFIILFLPWQQNIQGYGSLTALTPANRPQTIETVIAGRIEKWGIAEGQYVTRGDTIMVISEVKDAYFDPEYLTRLSEQISAKRGTISAKTAEIAALEQQLTAMRRSMVLKIEQANNKFQQAILKVQTDSAALEAAKLNYQIANDQYRRFKVMYDSGTISLNKLQQINLTRQKSEADQETAANNLDASRNARVIAEVDISATEAEFMDKISKAESDKSKASSTLFESEAELSKLTNQYANVRIRTSQYAILAPQDGYVVKALKAGLGQTIKEGEPVATIMPENPDVAVELYVKAMDVPLLSKGRKVRLEFDGWPALQFSGWPQVAVGTFGGVIEVIDFVDSKAGQYRILVRPDPTEEPWPNQLRLGSGVYGWAMLDEVPVWYEIWRQLNGFPPSLETEPSESALGKKAYADSAPIK